MSNYPQKIISSVLDLIFPKICLDCGKFTGNNDFDYVCKKCLGKTALKNVFECIGCKRQTQLGLTCEFCKKENSIDQLVIAAELSDPLIEKMLKAYKYKFISDMSKPLSVLAKKCIRRLSLGGFNIFESNPLIVSVPLHKRRFNWRGFNQARLLAEIIAADFLMCYENVLVRISYSKNQADITTRRDRFNNVRNSFSVINKEAVKDRMVVLVDDICTTGATLNECARVLKESGAKKVVGFVIARG